MEPNPVPARTIRARDVDPYLFAADIAVDVAQAAAEAVDHMPALPFLDRTTAPLFAWCYLREAVQYIAETGDQYIRHPWRTIEDGRADCKSQAVFVAGICGPLGCRVELCFAHLPGALHLGHVYPVVDGVPVDALLPFGDEVPSATVVRVCVAHGE